MTTQQITSSEKVETTSSEPDNTIDNNKVRKTSKISANLSKDVAKHLSGLKSLAPDWTYRRILIFRSMYFCGGVFGLIAVSVCLGMLLNYFYASKSQVDNGLINLAEALVSALTIFASSIIGAYCFGAAYENNSYRAHMTAMVTNIATSSEDSH